MLIGGLWHGANWTFVLWGGLHGFYLVINHLWRSYCQKRKIILTESKIYLGLCWLMTILLAWVIFRAKNFTTAATIYKSMFGFYGLSISPVLKGLVPEFFFFNYRGFFANQLFYFWDYLPLMVSSIVVCLFFPNIKVFLKNYFKFNGNSSNGSISFAEGGAVSLIWSPSRVYAIILSTMTVWIILTLLSHRKIEFLYFNF